MIEAALLALVVGALILWSRTDEDAGRFDRRTLDRLERNRDGSASRGWREAKP